MAPEDSIIFDVVWITNETLIVKEVSRAADKGNVVFFDIGASSFRGNGRVVRALGPKGEEGDEGWIDSVRATMGYCDIVVKADSLAKLQNIRPLSDPSIAALVGSSAYLDVIPNKDGYNHIALFSPADSSVPRWLTAGDWEVVGKVLGVDTKRGLVYFIAASASGLDRHVYSVPLPTVNGPVPSVSPLPKDPPTALTDISKPGYHSASFSPKSGYYMLEYRGPLIPYQQIVDVSNSSE